MRISFNIEKSDAVIGLMYYLSLGIEIKNKKDFRHEVTEYFRQNGTQCLDDHEYENEDYRERAEALVAKYF